MVAVVELHSVNRDALDLVEGLAQRIRSGEVRAVGIVEARRSGLVSTSWSQSPAGEFHMLNSGASILVHRLNDARDEC